jgi:transcription initiation factor IIF auxiliary subunit
MSNVEVKDSIFDPESSDRTARVQNPKSDKPLYRVFLYLEGLGLPYVNAVTYVLHPTFDEPTRQVLRTPANPRCKLEIWTWGLFQVQAIISDREGNMFTLSHDLQYSKDFQSPDLKFTAA